MLNYELLTQEPTLLNILNAFKDKLLYNEINCCRIAIVDEFYGDSLQVKVNIANKMVIGMKEDGSQIIQDYAPITAKICFANNGISFPLKQGDCGLLLFNDRELESWYINGDINQLAYDRSHSITDAIFIAGMFSQPSVSNAQFIENCLHLFYGTKGIKITNNGIEIDGDLKINGKINATGDIIAGNISLQHHTHPGVESGSGSTGQPQ
jgi:hypothetical protein